MYALDDLDLLLSDDPDGRRYLAFLATGTVQAHAPELGPCVTWTGATDTDGYAAFKVGGKTINGHMWLFKKLGGVLPDDHELDHLCHDPDLCAGLGAGCPHRPCQVHTAPVHYLQNWARSNAITVINALKTHCDGYQGEYHHELSPDNVYITPEGWRRCRKCQEMYRADYLRRVKISKRRLRELQMMEAGQHMLFDLAADLTQ